MDCPESERFCASNGCNIDRIGCSLPLSPVSPGSSRNPWPHNKSLASVCPGTSSLVRRALSRSEIDIDQLQISQQDLRILEILANRNRQENINNRSSGYSGKKKSARENSKRMSWRKNI